jgi:putative Mg2+ transporter-C (MgtC) family protein
VVGIGLAVGGGMYLGSISATIIILIILAGVKPIERRFIAVRRQRAVSIQAVRGSISLDSVHRALGSGSVQVKQFIVQQSENDPDLDDIHIAFSRTSANEFDTIYSRLERWKACTRYCAPKTPSALQRPPGIMRLSVPSRSTK